MRRTAKIALAALLTLGAACHKVDKDEQLKALDEAYKSGVFTKEEYDAKKQAIVGTPTAAPVPVPAPAVSAPAAPAAAPVAEPVQPASPPPQPVAAPMTQPVATPVPQPAAAPPPQQAAPRPAPQAVPATPVTPPPPAAAPPPPAEPAEAEPAPLAGCQDVEARAGGPNGVQQRFFPASEDVVRQAAIKAFTNLDFTIHESKDHQIEASKKGKLNTVVGGGAERVILHFASARQDGHTGTKVTAETKKGLVGRVTQKPWTGAVLAQIACNLRGR